MVDPFGVTFGDGRSNALSPGFRTFDDCASVGRSRRNCSADFFTSDAPFYYSKRFWDSLYLLYGDNGCARRAGDYIKGMISCGTVEGFDSSLVESFDVDSLAYSWNMGS